MARSRTSLAAALAAVVRSGLSWNENWPYEDARNSVPQMNESGDPYRHVLELELVSEPAT